MPKKPIVLKNKWLAVGLGIVIFLAFVTRLAVVSVIEMPPLSYSENSAIAVNMAAGKGYVYNFYGLRPDKPLLSFVPPLYTWIVWFCLVTFQNSTYALGMVHTILSTMSLPLVFFLTFKLSDNKIVAFLTMVGMAFYPPLILSIARPHTVTLNIFLVALLLAISVRLLEKQDTCWSVILGLAFGLALHSRPMLVPFLFILLIWFYLNGVRSKKVLTIGLIVTIMTLIVLTPWTIRNYVLHQQFVFMSANSGFNFWTGNNPFTTGSGHEVYTEKAYAFMNRASEENLPHIQEMHRYPLPSQIADEVATINEIELDRLLYQAGLDYIREHPQEWVQLMWVKFRGFVWFRLNIGNRYDESWTLYYKYLYGFLLLPFIAGLYLSAARWRRYLLLYLLFGFYTGFYTLYHVQMRFRWEIEPYFLVFIALLVFYIVDQLLEKWFNIKVSVE